MRLINSYGGTVPYGTSSNSYYSNYGDYYNNYNPITPCGYGTKYGNNTYSIPITFMVPTASGIDPTLTQNT